MQKTVAKKPNVLIVSAHADDHITCAGSVFKLQAQGFRAFEILLTNSQEGRDRRKISSATSNTVINLRVGEFDRATQFLGIKQKFLLDQEDLNLVFSKKLMFTIVKIIRDLQPEIIFSMNPFDYHSDHREAAHLVEEASFWAATGVKPELGEPHRTPIVLYGEGMLPITPQVLVDITDHIDQKMQLFSIYESQADSKSTVFEKSLSCVRGYHLRRSKENEYAEAFTLNPKFPSVLFDQKKLHTKK